MARRCVHRAAALQTTAAAATTKPRSVLTPLRLHTQVTAEFNQINGLELICRAHQLVQEGFKFLFSDGLVTVWSAPNYCYRCGNVAAILELDEHLTKNYKIFEAAPQEARGVPAKKPAPDYFL